MSDPANAAVVTTAHAFVSSSVNRMDDDILRKVFTETFFGISGKTVASGSDALLPALRDLALTITRSALSDAGGRHVRVSHVSRVLYARPTRFDDDEVSDAEQVKSKRGTAAFDSLVSLLLQPEQTIDSDASAVLRDSVQARTRRVVELARKATELLQGSHRTSARHVQVVVAVLKEDAAWRHLLNSETPTPKKRKAKFKDVDDLRFQLLYHIQETTRNSDPFGQIDAVKDNSEEADKLWRIVRDLPRGPVPEALQARAEQMFASH